MGKLPQNNIVAYHPPVALIHFNLRSRVLCMNARAEQIWSTSFQKAERKHCTEVCPLRKHAEQCKRCVVRMAVQDGKVHRQMQSGRAGETFFCMGLPMRDAQNNEINGSVLVLADISTSLDQERKLQASADQLKSLLSRMKEGVFIVNGEGVILAVSENEARKSGYGKKKLENKSFIDLFDGDEAREVGTLLAAAVENNGSSSLVSEYQYKDGRKGVGHFRFFPLSGTPEPSVLVTVQDVKDRERTLQERRLLKKAFDSSSDLLMIVDTDGAILHANKTALSELENGGKRLVDGRIVSRQGAPATRGDYPVSDDGPEKNVLRPVKEALKGICRIRTVEVGRGEKAYGYILTGETLEPGNAAPRGEKSDDSAGLPWHPGYSAVVNAMKAGIFIHDSRGIRYANSAFAHMVGRENDHLMGKSFVRLVSETDRATVERHMASIFSPEQVPHEMEFDCSLSCNGAETFFATISLWPFDFENKRMVMGKAIVVTDENMKWEQQMCATLQPRTGSLAAHLMREIGGPLQELFRAVEHLRQTPLSEAQKDACGRFDLHLDNINLAIQQMVVACSADNERKRIIDFNGIAEEAFHLTKTTLARKRIGLKYSLSPYVREVTASSHQILQLFIILINRAANDMYEGGILTVRSRKRGKSVHLEFSDTGLGSAEKQFLGFAGSESGAGKNREVDVPLSFVKDIIHNHGGSISVRSVLGKGSRLSLSLAIC